MSRRSESDRRRALRLRKVKDALRLVELLGGRRRATGAEALAYQAALKTLITYFGGRRRG